MTKQTKTQNKKTPSRSRKPKPRSQQKPNNKANKSVVMQMTKAICSLTDPFCKDAWGAKFPDGSTTRTFPYPLHLRGSVATNAAGGGAVLFLPGSLYNSYQDFSTVGGTCTFTALNGINGSGLTASSFRIVTCGIRLRNTSTPLSSSGMVRIRGFNVAQGTSLGVIDTSLYNCSFYKDIPLQDCKDIAVFFEKTAPMTALEFREPTVVQTTAGVSGWTSNGWGAVCVALIGGPASVSILDFELFVNYEYIFNDDNSLALASTKADAPNPIAIAASQRVQQSLSNTFYSGAAVAARYVEREAFAAASSYLSGAGSSTLMLM